MESHLRKTIKLSVVGMSASGKGTFIKKLNARLEAEGISFKNYKEDSDKKLFEIAKEDSKLMYLNQIKRAANIIARDVKAYNEVDKPQVQIMDRMPHETVFYNAALLSHGDYRKAKPFLKNLFSYHDAELAYDYVITLTASDSVIMERLENRGDVLDEEMKRKYRKINGYYNNTKGINIQANDYYFLDDVTIELMDEKMEFIINDIRKLLFDN